MDQIKSNLVYWIESNKIEETSLLNTDIPFMKETDNVIKEVDEEDD